MLQKIFFTLAIILGCPIWALECGKITTLSSRDYGSDRSVIATNSSGAGVIAWFAEGREGEAIQASTKLPDGSWSTPELITDFTSGVWNLYAFINEKGNSLIVWKHEAGDDDETLYCVEKPKDGSWSLPIPLTLAVDLYGYCIGKLDEQDRFFLVYDTEPDNRNDDRKNNFSLVMKKIGCEPTEHRFSLSDPSRGFYRPDFALAINNNHNPVLIANVHAYYPSSNKNVGFTAEIQSDGALSAFNEFNFPFEKEYLDLRSPVAMNDSGDLTLLASYWLSSEDENRDQLVAISRVGGVWQEPIHLSTCEQDAFNPQLASDNQGNLCVTWVSMPKNELKELWSAFKPQGKEWGAPRCLLRAKDVPSIDTLQAVAPGKFVALWEQREWRQLNIMGMTFSATEEKWSAPKLLSPPGALCIDVASSSTGNGTGELTWTHVPALFIGLIETAPLSFE